MAQKAKESNGKTSLYNAGLSPFSKMPHDCSVSRRCGQPMLCMQESATQFTKCNARWKQKHCTLFCSKAPGGTWKGRNRLCVLPYRSQETFISFKPRARDRGPLWKDELVCVWGLEVLRPFYLSDEWRRIGSMACSNQKNSVKNPSPISVISVSRSHKTWQI